MTQARRFPIGAEVATASGVRFRVWAPRRSRVTVVVEGCDLEVAAGVDLDAEGGGYFSGTVAPASAGSLYRFRLDGEPQLYPDPASRFQPDGPHGASQVIDPKGFRWTDGAWRGVAPGAQVIYELHVGTFTAEGTWRAAARELAELAASGITVIEVMPVADFPGRFGWGYDGVDLFAPTRLYGSPDDFRHFIDTAHGTGLAVILDVVYNHFGPDGCYLTAFSSGYFTDRYDNDWGDAINFDGQDSGPVREFFVANAAYWIEEFHLDGLRLDATQQIFDASPDHIIAAITRQVRDSGGERSTLVIAENEPQQVRLIRSVADGGYGVDALWNDDFHHTAMVAATGRAEAYYADYRGTPQELVSALKWGYLYQGQWNKRQKTHRGSPTFSCPPSAFVNYLQNHDQVANSARGERLHELTSPGRYRAISALLLLGPGIPMLFQGQEFAASSPFLFFADHKSDLAAAVHKGRAEFLSQFASIATLEARTALADPSAIATFQRSKLDLSERDLHHEIYSMHRDLLKLRREDRSFGEGQVRGVDGAVLGAEALALRYFGAAANDRLVLTNLGRDIALGVPPEPLLAAPEGGRWHIIWSSEDLKYGGSGTPVLDPRAEWWLPGHSTLVLAARGAEDETQPSTGALDDGE